MDKVLYFGTDARYWVLPSGERKIINEACRLIIEDLYPKFADNFHLNDYSFGNLFGEDLFTNNSNLLKDLYDSIFDIKYLRNNLDENSYEVTNLRLVACANALNSYGGGPHTKMAYLMIKAADLLGWINWKEDSWMTISKNLIKSFVEFDSSPVLFSFVEIDDEQWNRFTNLKICAFRDKIDENIILNLIAKNDNVHPLESVDKDFVSELKNPINRIPFLYHGTDARIVRMSYEERCRYINTCYAVVNYLWLFLEPLFHENKFKQYKDLFSLKGYPFLYENVYEKLSMVDMMNRGCLQYQYGDLYLTSREFSAVNYARRSFAGGEIGLIAFRMIEAAEIIGFDGLYENVDAVVNIKKVKQFATAESEPVIIQVKDLDPEYLLMDTGKLIDWSSIKVIPQLFRYVKDVVLDLNDIVALRND